MINRIIDFFRKKNPVDSMFVDKHPTAGWFICFKDGGPYAGPYSREKDAKGQLTRLRKGYTPAARIL